MDCGLIAYIKQVFTLEKVLFPIQTSVNISHFLAFYAVKFSCILWLGCRSF